MKSANQSLWDAPPGFQMGKFQNARGYDIRYGHVRAVDADKNGQGTLVLGPGYGEPIEKYYELISDLADAGYDIWIIDWLGQGRSARTDPNDHQRSYDVENFIEHHRDDLHQFVSQVVKAPQNHKLAYLGFSMGGHIGLRFLDRYPDVFDAAALNAAMIDFQASNRLHRLCVPSLVRAFCLAGRGSDYVPGGGNWQADRQCFDGNFKTQDQLRFQRSVDLLAKNPHLQTGDQRINWIKHALVSIRYLQDPVRLRAIKTPVLFSIAGEDKIVSVEAQKWATKQLANSKAIEYKQARHEIWMERDQVRNSWLKNLLSALNDHMITTNTPPVRLAQNGKASDHPPAAKPVKGKEDRNNRSSDNNKPK